MADFTQYEDQALVALLRQDDQEAFTEIYHRHWKGLYTHVLKRIRNADQSKDIVQEVFLDLWNRRSKATIDHIGAYLYAAVRFQVYKLVGKEKADAGFYALFAQLSDAPFGADALLREKEMAVLIHSWLDALPQKRRHIVLLHLAGKLSSREIAEKLSLSPKTVHNQWGHAVAALKSKIAGFVLLVSLLSLLLLAGRS